MLGFANWTLVAPVQPFVDARHVESVEALQDAQLFVLIVIGHAHATALELVSGGVRALKPDRRQILLEIGCIWSMMLVHTLDIKVDVLIQEIPINAIQ